MLHIDYTTMREIQRNPKKVSEEVNKTGTSLVVMSNNRPQFVIMGLKTFSKLQTPQKTNAELSLLGLIDWAEKKDFDLPSDLSEKHNEYLWGESEKSPQGKITEAEKEDFNREFKKKAMEDKF
jgi:prevent-host-death family protein